MVGTRKRPSTESGSPTRAAKAAKTENGHASKPASKGGKRGGKGAKAMAFSAFKAKALPLHVNITHTPPAIDEDATSVAAADPGFIGTSTLIASSFSTGSYGWKGNKRFTMELENPESGEKEKVQIMLTMNATVIGSKQAKGDEEDDAEEKAEEAAEEEIKDAEAPVEADVVEAVEEKHEVEGQ